MNVEKKFIKNLSFRINALESKVKIRLSYTYLTILFFKIMVQITESLII